MELTPNMIIQWTEEITMYTEDEPSRLNLVFTKCVNLKGNIKYLSPRGKSDHVLLEIEVMGNKDEDIRK